MLDSKQRGRLSSIAQTRSCLVTFGRAGMSPELVRRLAELLEQHELVKLRFGGFGESQDPRGFRVETSRALAQATGGELVRLVGNVAVFWRQNPDPGKRKSDVEL